MTDKKNQSAVEAYKAAGGQVTRDKSQVIGNATGRLMRIEAVRNDSGKHIENILHLRSSETRRVKKILVDLADSGDMKAGIYLRVKFRSIPGAEKSITVPRWRAVEKPEITTATQLGRSKAP